MTINVYDEGGRVRSSLPCDFSVIVDDCTWRIRTQFPETNILELDYCESGTDGISVYVLKSFVPSVTNKTTKHVTRVNGKRVVEERVGTWPKAEGHVYLGVAPKPDESFSAPIWLAMASRCVINTNQTGRLPQVWPFDDHELLAQEFSLQVQWQILSANGNFPERIVFFSDGNYYGRRSGESIIIRAPPPYDQGYTNAIYFVKSITNLGGVSFPKEFALLRYKPKFGGNSTNDLVLLTEYASTVEHLEEFHGGKPLLPEVPPSVAIVDNRFFSELGQSVVYLSTRQGWLTTEEVRKLPNYKMKKISSGFSANMASKKINLQLVRTILLICLVGPVITAMFWLYRKNQTKPKRDKQ